jgi:hypothetical protein
MNLNRVLPPLLEWASHFSHLREVTAADVITATQPLSGSLRRQTLTALRPLFRHAKTAGKIKRAITVTRHPDAHWPGRRGHRLVIAAITGITRAIAGRVALHISQVVIELGASSRAVAAEGRRRTTTLVAIPPPLLETCLRSIRSYLAMI